MDVLWLDTVEDGFVWSRAEELNLKELKIKEYVLGINHEDLQLLYRNMYEFYSNFLNENRSEEKATLYHNR